MDVFETIKNALDLIVGKAYEIMPILENASTIITYVLSVLLFLLFFSIPTIIIVVIYKNVFCKVYSENDSIRGKRKRRR